MAKEPLHAEAFVGASLWRAAVVTHDKKDWLLMTPHVFRTEEEARLFAKMWVEAPPDERNLLEKLARMERALWPHMFKKNRSEDEGNFCAH